MHRHQELRDAPVDIVAAGEPAARDRQPRLVRIDLDHRARVFGDPAHVIGIHPRDRIDEVLLDIEDLVLFLVEGQMREGEMRGVDRAFQRLHPVAVLPFLRDVAMRGRHQRHFQIRQVGHCIRRAHIGPDHVAPFAHRIGLDADQVLCIEIGIRGRHVDAAAVGVELPAVIDAADAAFLVAAKPEIGAAMRTILVDHADHAPCSRGRPAVPRPSPRSSSAGNPVQAIPPTATPAARTGAASRPSASPRRSRSAICCPRRGASPVLPFLPLMCSEA